MAAAVLVLTACLVAASHQAETRIQVTDGRPLAVVLAELEKRYGRVVTYEDPLRIHSSDVADITDTVPVERRRREKILMPKGMTFTFSYTSPSDASDRNIEAMLKNLLAQFNRASADAQFRLSRTRTIFHVAPSMSKTLKGILAKSTPMLDTRISVADAQRTGLDQLTAIRDALRAAGQPRFDIGVVPFAALKNLVSGGVRNEPAREAIVRVLDSSPYKISYVLYCDAGVDPMCLLSLHGIPAGSH